MYISYMVTLSLYFHDFDWVKIYIAEAAYERNLPSQNDMKLLANDEGLLVDEQAFKKLTEFISKLLSYPLAEICVIFRPSFPSVGKILVHTPGCHPPPS